MPRAHLTGHRSESGFALVTAMLLLALLLTLVGAYFTATHLETLATRSTMDGFRGYYAAEAGLNIRSIAFRPSVTGFSSPGGSSPTLGNPCSAGNLGAGDLGCTSLSLENRTVRTYVVQDPASPSVALLPRGELFQDLASNATRFALISEALRGGNIVDAGLQMNWVQHRLPLFQFAAFYNKDLEILPSSALSLSGPIHTNGDLFLGPSAGNTLQIQGQLSAAGSLFKGRKDADSCLTGTASVANPSTLSALPACSGSRLEITNASVANWNGMVRVATPSVATPGTGLVAASAGSPYWTRADLRIVLDLNAAPAIQIRDGAGAVNVLDSTALATCGAVSEHTAFYNHREAGAVHLLDVELDTLINCIHSNGLLGAGIGLDETSDGGLVLFLSVDGPDDSIPNLYGVRVKQAAELASSVLGAPAIAGLTIASDQALYIQGDFNTVNKKAASLVADSINVLSNSWADPIPPGTSTALSARTASDTTINAAILAGSDTTGGSEGSAGRDSGGYNGGLENLVRLHEDWSGDLLRLRGSLVSPFAPLHVDGPFATGGLFFQPPNRDFVYDADFDSLDKLPPLTPRGAYTVREPIVRLQPL